MSTAFKSISGFSMSESRPASGGQGQLFHSFSWCGSRSGVLCFQVGFYLQTEHGSNSSRDRKQATCITKGCLCRSVGANQERRLGRAGRGGWVRWTWSRTSPCGTGAALSPLSYYDVKTMTCRPGRLNRPPGKEEAR